MSRIKAFLLAFMIGLTCVIGFLILAVNSLIFIDYLWLVIPSMLVLLVVWSLITKHFYFRFRGKLN